MVLILCLAVKPDLSMAVMLSTFRVGSDPLDVVISEVAWMGTAHSAYDEWIELRNNTSEPVSLEDWRLTDGDDLDIALEGVIPAQGCLLLERTDDTTVSDIPADLIYTGSLHDSGEVLTLTNETGAVIDAVDAADGWPAGSRVLRQTMERVDPRTDGGAGNWVTNSGVYRNGRDAGGGPVYGTPREPNSASRNRGEEGAILISAVHLDGYQPDDSDQGFRLYNTATRTVTLTGWTVSNEDVTFALSDSLALASGESVWCAREATPFALSFGFHPDLEYGTGGVVGEAFVLDARDWLVLRDTAGAVIDAVAWGEDVTLEGWSGPAVRPHAGSGIPASGQILFRKRVESTGLVAADSDTAADWANSDVPGDALYGPVREGDVRGKRVLYPGWEWNTYTDTFEVAAGALVTVGIAPDNLYAVISDLIGRAKESILISGYTFESVWLTGVLTERIEAGVQVTMLLEGAPAGGLSEQELWSCKQLVDAGGRVYFTHADHAAGIYRRYANHHAKFLVVDRSLVGIGTENYGNHGMPADDKSNGTAGYRGVFLITDQADVTAYVEALFAEDCDPIHHRDIVAYGETERFVVPPTYTAVYSTGGGGYDYMAPFSSTAAPFEADHFEVVRAPETSLRTSDGMIGLVLRAGAGDHVCVQQLYERLQWGLPSGSVVGGPNPRLEAYIQAARQGATVRILLDRGFDNEGENRRTALYVLDVARAEGLDLDVRLGDPARRAIHSKMVLVRLGDAKYVHVGSINGSEVSSKANRELALQVRSPGVYDYLLGVFEYDWAHSSGPYEVRFPAVFKDHVPEADHVLISEVVFKQAGSAELGEWVELYNPTAAAVDIGGWYLGDAVRQADYERLYSFPPGTSIASKGTLVVARTAMAYQSVGYAGKPVPDLEWNDSNQVPEMRLTSWGDGDFALGNTGDEVLLLDPSARAVDVLVYGTGRYRGVVTFGDVSTVYNGSSLERWPANRDSNDCSHDFRVRYDPDPGQVRAW